MAQPQSKDVYLNSETIIQPQAYSFLKRYASQLSPVDRLVTLTFSEYKLCDVVPVDYKYDDQPPPNFIVVGVHFINVDRYQPIGTLFLYDESYAKGKTPSSKDLADCLRLYILAIARIPLTVVSTVAPPSGTFKKALSNLIGVTDMTSFDGPLVYSVFEVKNIIHLYDPPSLLRAFRNFFMHQDIEFKISEKVFVASWKDIVALFARNKLAFLEKEHICPTRKITQTNYAVPIFSNKVRNVVSDAVKSNMLPLRAIGTSVLLKIFNDLFDSFNSSGLENSTSTRQLISKKSYHHTFWDNTLKILPSIFFLDNTFRSSGNVKSNLKYSDSQKVIADDPMGDICIDAAPSCNAGDNPKLNTSHIFGQSLSVKDENHIRTQALMASSNHEDDKQHEDKLDDVQAHCNFKNTNGKIDVSLPEERKQAKMSTLRKNFLDGLRNTSVVEFKESKDITKKKNLKNCTSNGHPNKSKVADLDHLKHNNNNNNDDNNATIKNAKKFSENSYKYTNGQTRKNCSQEEDEAGLKRFIAEFSRCDVKDCYGFFEDKDCDIEMECMPLLNKERDGKNRTKKTHYESVSRTSAACSEDYDSKTDSSAVSTIKLAVNELKEIEDIVKSSEDTSHKSKRTTKRNRKKLKLQKKDVESIDAVLEIDNSSHNSRNVVNDKENKQQNHIKSNKTTYPLNNSLEKERPFNPCIKKLNFFTENDTNSQKILIESSHSKKTDVKSNNIKTNCDIANNVNKSTINMKKKKVQKPSSVHSESEQTEDLNTLLDMDVDKTNKGAENVGEGVANGTQSFPLDNRPLLPLGKLEPENSCNVSRMTFPMKSSFADDKISNGIKEMLEIPGFESDSEPEMPSIPISDILEKLEATDTQPAKLKYVKHEITSNWMSNIQGMQLITKRLKKEGLKQFSSKVFSVDCTHCYVSHVRDANHRRVPNATSFGKSIAKLLDPYHAVLAISKGTAVLLP